MTDGHQKTFKRQDTPRHKNEIPAEEKRLQQIFFDQIFDDFCVYAMRI